VLLLQPFLTNVGACELAKELFDCCFRRLPKRWQNPLRCCTSCGTLGLFSRRFLDLKVEELKFGLMEEERKQGGACKDGEDEKADHKELESCMDGSRKEELVDSRMGRLEEASLEGTGRLRTCAGLGSQQHTEEQALWPRGGAGPPCRSCTCTCARAPPPFRGSLLFDLSSRCCPQHASPALVEGGMVHLPKVCGIWVSALAQAMRHAQCWRLLLLWHAGRLLRPPSFCRRGSRRWKSSAG